MICSKCGNEIAVGRVCGKCGNIEGQTTAEKSSESGMRVTAYGAVVPENSGVYVASSLGMAMLAEDTGASEAGELKESEELKDDGEVMPETKQSEVASAYATSASEEEAETVVANKVEDVAEAIETEASATYAEQEETDTEKILEKARAKSAKTFAASSMVSFQEELDLKLEEPVAYNPYGKGGERKTRKGGIARKIIPLIVFVIVALVATPFIIKFVIQINCDKQIKDIVTMLNEKDTSVDGFVDAIFPYFVADAYHEMELICEGNLQYQGNAATTEAEYRELMTSMYDMIGLTDNQKYTYKIKERKALTKEEMEAIERAYDSMSVLTSGMQAVYESMGTYSVLDQAELDLMADVVVGVGEKMSNLDISAGYVLTLELDVTNSKTTKENLDVVVVRADKKWMIEYVSSVLVNKENANYELRLVDQFVDVELNVNRLNDQLKRMSEYAENEDFNGLVSQILNGMY